MFFRINAPALGPTSHRATYLPPLTGSYEKVYSAGSAVESPGEDSEPTNRETRPDVAARLARPIGCRLRR